MAKVFLSHSSQDKVLVEFIAKELGLSNVILDSYSFEKGQKTINEIYRTMSSSDVFVLFISNDALNSEWVEKEIFYADGLIRNEKLSTFLPIVIDRSIKHDDSRIPIWLRKEFNLRFIDNERILINKIKNSIREVNFKLNPANEEIENTFIGQNELIAKEEKKFYNLDNWKPSCIIAYNSREGIGRRTTIKNLLKKVGLYRNNYHPVEISISKESIESLILKLNSTILDEGIINKDLSVITIDEKIKIAADLIDMYSNNQEYLFIIDDGSIVLPNSRVVDWFKKLLSDERFNNKLVLCLISNFRPNDYDLQSLNKTLDFKVEELSKGDTQSLFLKYLEIFESKDIETDDKKAVIEKLTGVPSQIIYAAHLVKNVGILETKRNIDKIVKFSDFSSLNLIEIIKSDKVAFDILLLLSESPDVFTWSLIYKVFKSEYSDVQIDDAIQKLYDLSVFSFLYGGYEHLKLSPTLADYITRANLKIDNRFKLKLNSIIKKDLEENDLDKLYKNDYSEFLITIQSMISSGQPVNKKYFIPSIVLKSIIKEYDKGRDEVVVKLCNELLENSYNSVYDSQMIWELHYKLCQSLAKLKKSEDFFMWLRYFQDNNVEYNFLLGFFYRHNRDKNRALEYYNRVLIFSPEHKRAKQELVNLYLSKGEYMKAYTLAESIYKNNKQNIYNIHSYFICIVRTGKAKSNIGILDELLEGAKKSLSKKGQDMYRCMAGEYEFYVNDDLKEAISKLEEAKIFSDRKSYPTKALDIIYKKMDMREALKNNKFSDNNDDDVDYLDTI